MKICNKCKQSKELSEFYKRAISIDGLNHRCKNCNADEKKAYFQTKRGVISKIFYTQKKNSIIRKHNLPTYSREDLIDWLLVQERFNVIFNKWKESGFKRNLMPSIDRLDDFKGYTFDNIQTTTLKYNEAKGHKDRKTAKGTQGLVCTPILQYDKQMNLIAEHISQAEASRSPMSFIPGMRRPR